MVFSPFGSPINRPSGSRQPYSAAKVSEVRRLVETTLFTHVEIAQRTGVTPSAVGRWALDRKWMRPGFAPRSTRTVPAWRAGRTRRRRMLALRLVALAERYVSALEAAGAVDAARLPEARALLAMAKRVTLTPRQRLLAAVRPVAERQARTPGKTVARNARRAPRATPDRAVDGMIESPRQSAPPQPHPAAIRREQVPLSKRT